MSRSTGFTLIELLIATAILIVALVGILAAYQSCFSLTETARNLTAALNADQAKMEEMRNYNFNLLATDYGTGGVNNIFPASGLSGNRKGKIYIQYVSSPQDGSLLQVKVVICWQERGGRVVGEDKNLNGVLDTAPLPSEDTNGNGEINSPCELTTLMAQR